MGFDSIDGWQFVALVGTGFAAGLINAVAGGGSLITLSLMLWIGLPAPVANASNRVSLILQNTSATVAFHRRGRMHWPTVALLSACAVPSALFGAWIAADISETSFRRILCGILVVSILVVARGTTTPGTRKEPVGRRALALWFVIAGFYGGFIQAGLGFAMIALISGVGKLDLVRTNAIKVAVILMIQIGSLAIFSYAGTVDWAAGLALALGSASGAWISVHWQISRETVWVRRFVVILLTLFTLRLLSQEFLA